MKILWVATKAPWPPVDGGRLLLLNTLRALSAAGHQITLIAPIGGGDDGEQIAAGLRPYCRPSLVTVRRRPLVADVVRAQITRAPLTIVRHTLPAVRRRVSDHLAGHGDGSLSPVGTFDLIQVEQVQALSSVPMSSPRPPVVLRAQNVESDLWAQSGRRAFWSRPLLALEARRLAAWEGRAVRRCVATLALTVEDVERLGGLAGADVRIHHVPAPFEPVLPAATRSLSGSPPMVLFGSGGWRPNAGGADWFVNRIWPRMHAARPGAVLHVFGIDAAGPGVVSHPAPEDSRAAYPSDGVLVVPLKVASGVRIKILEAWARGVPVIATPEAARGLQARDGVQLLLARDGEEFVAAMNRIGSTANTLVANGRRHLREHHGFSRLAERLTDIYEDLARSAGGAGRR